MLTTKKPFRYTRIPKKLTFIGVLLLIVFFFVGTINLDNEFWEAPRWFIKLPPTYKFVFNAPVMDLSETTNQIQYDIVLASQKRVQSYKSMEPFGDILAFSLFQLLLAIIFIKPVFSKKMKFILLDIALLTVAGFITFICSMILFIDMKLVTTVICVIIALSANYLLLRLLRPTKRM